MRPQETTVTEARFADSAGSASHPLVLGFRMSASTVRRSARMYCSSRAASSRAPSRPRHNAYGPMKSKSSRRVGFSRTTSSRSERAPTRPTAWTNFGRVGVRQSASALRIVYDDALQRSHAPVVVLDRAQKIVRIGVNDRIRNRAIRCSSSSSLVSLNGRIR